MQPRWPADRDTNWHVNQLHPTTSRELWSPESVRILRPRCWMVSVATLNEGNLVSSCTMTCPHHLTQRIEIFWRIMLNAVSFPLPFLTWEWLGSSFDTAEWEKRKIIQCENNCKRQGNSEFQIPNWWFGELYNVMPVSENSLPHTSGKVRESHWKLRPLVQLLWHEVF